MELQLWRTTLEPYALAVDELVVKMNHIKNEFEFAGEYSPIETVSGRVKRISSILEKAQRKNIELDDVEKKLDDIAGVRIICRFVEDIDKVVEILRKRSDMVIVQEKDYIRKNFKPVIKIKRPLFWWLSGKKFASNAGDLALIPGLGRSPGEGNGNPLQYSCLENPIDRGAWQATVHGIVRVGQ